VPVAFGVVDTRLRRHGHATGAVHVRCGTAVAIDDRHVADSRLVRDGRSRLDGELERWRRSAVVEQRADSQPTQPARRFEGQAAEPKFADCSLDDAGILKPHHDLALQSLFQPAHRRAASNQGDAPVRHDIAGLELEPGARAQHTRQICAGKAGRCVVTAAGDYQDACSKQGDAAAVGTEHGETAAAVFRFAIDAERSRLGQQLGAGTSSLGFSRSGLWRVEQARAAAKL
jgi:hypothetical protein